MSNETLLIEMIREQRVETREQFSEMRDGINNMTTVVNDLSKTIVRMEENAMSQNSGLKRVGAVVDEHGKRLIVLENAKHQIFGSWKAITVMGGLFTTMIALAVTVLKLMGII